MAGIAGSIAAGYQNLPGALRGDDPRLEKLKKASSCPCVEVKVFIHPMPARPEDLDLNFLQALGVAADPSSAAMASVLAQVQSNRARDAVLNQTTEDKPSDVWDAQAKNMGDHSIIYEKRGCPPTKCPVTKETMRPIEKAADEIGAAIGHKNPRKFIIENCVLWDSKKTQVVGFRKKNITARYVLLTLICFYEEFFPGPADPGDPGDPGPRGGPTTPGDPPATPLPPEGPPGPTTPTDPADPEEPPGRTPPRGPMMSVMDNPVPSVGNDTGRLLREFGFGSATVAELRRRPSLASQWKSPLW